ncbi:MAG: hypothetical protein MUO73_06975 [Thermoplasmata archaeon]|nr:hypothetical protein [Thermoplasmata archaeon]
MREHRVEDMPDEPLSMEPFVSILKRKLRDPKTKMIRPWIRMRIDQLTQSDKPKKKKSPFFVPD